MFGGSGYGFAGLLALAVLAFWPAYLSRLSGGGIAGRVHVHAIAMVLWFALLAIQPFLIRYDRRAWHRRLGALSYAIAPTVVALAAAALALLMYAERGQRRGARCSLRCSARSRSCGGCGSRWRRRAAGWRSPAGSTICR